MYIVKATLERSRFQFSNASASGRGQVHKVVVETTLTDPVPNPNWRHGTGAGYNCSNGSWQVQLLHAQNTPNELEQL